ncbi:MAG TPA: endonuclease, partial [Tenuifilaceae bacterium]|nr:endonuclease [Tenuifilaceae bacterium]
MKNRFNVLNEKFRILTRKGTLLISLLLSFQILLGQIPSGYYDAAQGKSGAELKTALYNTIKDHTVISYSGLWTAYQNTDEKSSGKIWDMYSDIPGGTPPYEYTYSTDQCGSYSSEGDCYNREHSFPKSWFNDASPMYSDLFHIYPTDGKVNGMRSNYIFGNVENVSWTSLNGSKLGTSTESGATLTEFEPIDEYKGDFARTYFYMATRYENLIASWVGNAADGDEILAGNSYPAYKDWYVQLLLRWHKEDPVSQKEIDRNNAVYNDYQHNRNPFIDHPEYAEEIWGTPTGSISFTSTPITSATVNTAYSYNITATGGDGSAITISATTKPDWLTIA